MRILLSILLVAALVFPACGPAEEEAMEDKAADEKMEEEVMEEDAMEDEPIKDEIGVEVSVYVSEPDET